MILNESKIQIRVKHEHSEKDMHKSYLRFNHVLLNMTSNMEVTPEKVGCGVPANATAGKKDPHEAKGKFSSA